MQLDAKFAAAYLELLHVAYSEGLADDAQFKYGHDLWKEFLPGDTSWAWLFEGTVT